jgi:hypothetical protein
MIEKFFKNIKLSPEFVMGCWLCKRGRQKKFCMICHPISIKDRMTTDEINDLKEEQKTENNKH